MNYRLALLFGHGRHDQDLGGEACRAGYVDRASVVGRWEEARQPTEKELQATTLVAYLHRQRLGQSAVVVHHLMTKKTTSLPIWAGVLPIRQQFLERTR